MEEIQTARASVGGYLPRVRLRDRHGLDVVVLIDLHLRIRELHALEPRWRR
jgi:hypothetical protein